MGGGLATLRLPSMKRWARRSAIVCGSPPPCCVAAVSGAEPQSKTPVCNGGAGLCQLTECEWNRPSICEWGCFDKDGIFSGDLGCAQLLSSSELTLSTRPAEESPEPGDATSRSMIDAVNAKCAAAAVSCFKLTSPISMISSCCHFDPKGPPFLPVVFY